MNRKQQKSILEKSFVQYVLEEGQNYIGQNIVEPSADVALIKMLGKDKYDKLAVIIDKIEQKSRDGQDIINYSKMERLDVFFPITRGDDAIRYFKAYAGALTDKKIATEINNLLK